MTTGVDPDDVTPRTWPVTGRHTLRDPTQQPHRQKQNVDGGSRGPGLRGRRAVVSWTELRTAGEALAIHLSALWVLPTAEVRVSEETSRQRDWAPSLTRPLPSPLVLSDLRSATATKEQMR